MCIPAHLANITQTFSCLLSSKHIGTHCYQISTNTLRNWYRSGPNTLHASHQINVRDLEDRRNPGLPQLENSNEGSAAIAALLVIIRKHAPTNQLLPKDFYFVFMLHKLGNT